MFKQWSRLIAGTSLDSSRGSKNSSNHPEKRLARFKKQYSQLLVWGLQVFDHQLWAGLTVHAARMAQCIQPGK
jgi:hypothetical protein